MISCEGDDVQALFKHPIRLILNSCFLFSQWPWDGQNLPKLGVSVGCLEDVWEVSGGCLSDSGLWLGGMMCKHFLYIPLDSLLIAASFFPSGLGMAKTCPYGVCRVSGSWGV